MIRPSFITVNYVARALQYSGKVGDQWGKFDQATVQNSTTDDFQQICMEVADAGFECIDVWAAHCHDVHHAHGDYLETIKGWISQFDLTITSYASELNINDRADIDRTLRFMKQLGAPLFVGGVWGSMPREEALAAADEICAKLGVRWAYENHAEKSADEILKRIRNGRYKQIGVGLDTGFCGMHNMDAVDVTKRLRDKLLIVHLKDVIEIGGHETCALGDGIVDCEGVVRSLVDSGWSGTLSIEHVPFDRDPMPEVITSLKRVKEWLG